MRGIADIGEELLGWIQEAVGFDSITVRRGNMEQFLYPMIFKRKSFHLFKDIGHISDGELSQIEEAFRTFQPLIPEIKVEMKIKPAKDTTCSRGQEYCVLLYSEKKDGYHAAQDRLDDLQKLRITRSFQADVLECFMFEIKAIDTTLPLEFTDRFWNNLIDRVTVYHDGRMVFRFKNGAEVTETL